jgi:hypothetical protein
MAYGPEIVAYTPSARSAAAETWRKAPRTMRGEATEPAQAIGITIAG